MAMTLTGLQGPFGGATSAQVVAALTGQDVVARSYQATGSIGGAGLNAFQINTTGNRLKFSTGVTGDWLSSDGNQILSGSDFGTGASLSVRNSAPVLTIGSAGSQSFRIDGLTGIVYLGGSNGTGSLTVNTTLISSAAPSVSSGFGSGASVVNPNGSSGFTVNVGTGGVASTGIIAMNASGLTPTHGWIAHCVNLSNNSVTRMTSSTTTTITIANFSATTGLSAPWSASDIIGIIAMGY